MANQNILSPFECLMERCIHRELYMNGFLSNALFCNIWGHEEQYCGKKVAVGLANASTSNPVNNDSGNSGEKDLTHPSPTKVLVADRGVEEADPQMTIEKHPQLGKHKEIIDSIVDSGKKLNEELQNEEAGSLQITEVNNTQGEEVVEVGKLSKKQRRKKKHKQQQGASSSMNETVAVVSLQQIDQLNVTIGEMRLEVSGSMGAP